MSATVTERVTSEKRRGGVWIGGDRENGENIAFEKRVSNQRVHPPFVNLKTSIRVESQTQKDLSIIN